MRRLQFTTVSVELSALWLGVVILSFESGVCGELLSNGSAEISNNSSETTGRGSRQLWSLVKTVIKTGLDQGNGGGSGGSIGSGGGAGGLGSLASGVLSAIAGGINSNGVGGGGQQYYQQQQTYHQNPNPSQFSNPNEYMHYLLMNSQSNQHTSLPHYLQQQKKEQDSTADLIEKYKEQMAAGSENVETANTGNQILNKLALGTVFDDLDKVSNLLSFSRIEGMVEKVNKFDKLKCIPRLLCQMVSKRKEDEKKQEQKAKEREDSNATTKKPTSRKSDDNVDEDDKKSRKEDDEEEDKEEEKREDSKEKGESEEDDEEGDEDDEDEESEEVKEYVVIKKGAEDEGEKKHDKEDDGKKKKGRRNGRFLNLNGSDTALEQFVKFLDLMQLKDWSIYPYLHGAYQGHQVSRAEECAYRFSSCPFSDEQLVYYFNNYNGGFFQSI